MATELPFLTLPDSNRREDFLAFIKELSKQSESPEWLGLPSSAELLIRADAGRETSFRLAKLQDGGGDGGSGGGKTRSEVAREMITFADLILSQLPAELVSPFCFVSLARLPGHCCALAVLCSYCALLLCGAVRCNCCLPLLPAPVGCNCCLNCCRRHGVTSVFSHDDVLSLICGDPERLCYYYRLIAWYDNPCLACRLCLLTFVMIVL